MSDPTPWIVGETGPAAKKHAPATERNRDAILAVLAEVLPEAGLALEIASGSGEHAVAFARAFPALDWQPSDPDAGARRSIAAWAEEAGLPNLHAPIELDAAEANWPLDRVDAMLCINMIHISPWRATEGLFAGAARLLPPGAPLYVYGPYIREGVETAPSNLAFDRSLRSRDPAWGLRCLEAVAALAEAHGLMLERVVEMPANNISAIFRRG